jgi:hypothetical protein
MSYSQIKHGYILGIQPESIEAGEKISSSVHTAIEEILSYLNN